MNQNEADQRNAAFSELRSFWENGYDPIKALGYLRTKYPDNVVQYAANKLAYHRPQNGTYRVGSIYPELESYQFNTPRPQQISQTAQDIGNRIGRQAYAFTHAKAYPKVFGGDSSLESKYASQVVAPSTEEKDTENQVEQNALNTSSEATEDTYPKKPLQETNLKKGNFVFPQEPPKEGSNIKTANLGFPDGGKVPQELNKVSKVKPRVIQDTSNGPIVLNDPNHRTTRDVQVNDITPERAAADQMVNQFTGIPVEVIRAKNSGYAQPPLNHATDAIWDRVRKAGLSSPEQAIRSGIFSPDEVRYITENDLWRYRQ